MRRSARHVLSVLTRAAVTTVIVGAVVVSPAALVGGGASAAAPGIGDVELSIAMTIDKESVDYGDNIAFNIVVTNTGASPAAGVVVSDILPDGVVPVSATDAGATCAITENTVTCSGITVPANGGTYPVEIIARATGHGDYLTVATVDCGPGPFELQEPTSQEPTLRATTMRCTPNLSFSTPRMFFSVNRFSDLAITVTSNPTEIMLGQTVELIVTLTNNGPHPAINISSDTEDPHVPVPVPLPAPRWSDFVSAIASQGDVGKCIFNIPGPDPWWACWKVGTLEVGATATMTLVERPNYAGDLVSTATVVLSESADEVPANNQSQVVISVLAAELPATGDTSTAITTFAVGALALGAALRLVSRRTRCV